MGTVIISLYFATLLAGKKIRRPPCRPFATRTQFPVEGLSFTRSKLGCVCVCVSWPSNVLWGFGGARSVSAGLLRM